MILPLVFFIGKLNYEYDLTFYNNLFLQRLRRTCKVECTYSDGNTETYNSPNNQFCCDVGGALPTGVIFLNKIL